MLVNSHLLNMSTAFILFCIDMKILRIWLTYIHLEGRCCYVDSTGIKYFHEDRAPMSRISNSKRLPTNAKRRVRINWWLLATVFPLTM